MSDSRLRELERRFRKTGAVEDEAAYLLERVRVGDLAQEKLELAAYCGHEGARLASGQIGSETPDGLEEWIRGLPADQAVACGVALRLSRSPGARICTTSHLRVLRHALRNGADSTAVRSAASQVLIHRALGWSDPFRHKEAWLALGLPDPALARESAPPPQAPEALE